MLFSGIVGAAGVAGVGKVDGAGVETADGLSNSRCQKRKPATASAAIAAHTKMIRPRFRSCDVGGSAATGAASLLSGNFDRLRGLSEFPSSAVKRLTTETRTPCFTSHSPRS